MKKIIAMLLVLVMAASLVACGGSGDASKPAETQAPAESQVSADFYQVGDKIEDFTITTYDGKEVSLYKVLEEKDMVLLNLWATYCGPCAQEFPAMQEAYEQYQDKLSALGRFNYNYRIKRGYFITSFY